MLLCIARGLRPWRCKAPQQWGCDRGLPCPRLCYRFPWPVMAKGAGPGAAQCGAKGQTGDTCADTGLDAALAWSDGLALPDPPANGGSCWQGLALPAADCAAGQRPRATRSLALPESRVEKTSWRVNAPARSGLPLQKLGCSPTGLSDLLPGEVRVKAAVVAADDARYRARNPGGVAWGPSENKGGGDDARRPYPAGFARRRALLWGPTSSLAF